MSIPIIDFASFDTSPAAGQAVGDDLFKACRDVGFVYLKNCVPESSIQEMFEWSKKFFDLPEEKKKLAPHPAEGWKHRGWSGIGLEKVSASLDVDKQEQDKSPLASLPDYKETFDLGTEGDTVLENVWPPDNVLPSFRSACNNFYSTCRVAQLKVLRALAMGFPGLDADFFDKCHQNGDNQLRLLYYPGWEASEGERPRCRPHSDFGTCTFLFQHEIGGLEVEDPMNQGSFISVPPIPGTIVFNLGDFLRRMSNDTLKSTMHRVSPPTTSTPAGGVKVPSRYSIAFFCGADREKTMEVLPGSYGPDRPRKYEPMSVSEYIDLRMNALYA